MSSAAPVRARPAEWAITALHTYVRQAARRQFHGWSLQAEDLAAVEDPGAPLLLLANHTSWWDGFVAFELTHWLRHRCFVMMQADQLRQAKFFSYCGAFSLERDVPRQAYRDLRYAATLLAPGHAMWMFPQGRRCPADAPIVPEAGVARLLAWAPGVRVVPVAFRYGFLSEEHPEVFVWLGTPWTAGPDEPMEAVLERVRLSMTQARDRLDAALATTEREGFIPLLAGAPSANKRLTALLARWGLADAGTVRNG